MSEHWEGTKRSTNEAVIDANDELWCWVAEDLSRAIDYAHGCLGRERKWARRRLRNTFRKLIAELEKYAQTIDRELAKEVKQ